MLAQTDATIRGRPKDQWAFKELSHKGQTLLGVFTTTGKQWSDDPADRTNNHFFVLGRAGAELPVKAKLSDIAPGEVAPIGVFPNYMVIGNDDSILPHDDT